MSTHVAPASIEARVTAVIRAPQSVVPGASGLATYTFTPDLSAAEQAALADLESQARSLLDPLTLSAGWWTVGHVLTATDRKTLALQPPAGIPAGVIVMWGGLVANIPAGWVLCNGQNGTPDLRDRFVKGAAAGQNPGATGGATTHTHAAHTGIINHTHTVSVTDPGHAHVQGVNSAATGALSGYTADTSTNTRVNSGYSTSSATTGITASTANPAGGVASVGHDSPDSQPPYYALCFIQKT